MDLKFGTSGLRGLSTALIGEAASVHTAGFCRHLLASGKAKAGDPILVGRDFRRSSPEIAENCMAAIAAEGFQPVDCGTLPTPALCYYGFARQAASVMVTGSHIPADRNGIKFYTPTGEITKDDEVAITQNAAAMVGTVPVARQKGEDLAAEAMALFFARNIALLPEKALSGMKIGVYQHSTVARDLLVDLLAHYGAEVTALGRSETFIPVDTEAVSDDTIALLKGWAETEGFDAIVSADGDADRPLVADEAGTPLRGDLIGLMTARFLGAGVVVTPVTSNSGIEKNGDFDVVRTRVGSPYVIAGMEAALEAGQAGVIGFEANGGFLTGSPFAPSGKNLEALPTRDCFLPILSLLYLAASAGKPLSAVAAGFNLPVAAADRIQNFAQTRSAALMDYLRGPGANLSAFLAPVGKVAAKSDIDGLRVTLEDGRIIHFRPSGNAPEMRCYVEAESAAAAAELLKQGLALIAAHAAE
ncbi:phosphomannomutase [Martelella alba]|uniref:Phosphomannomutase n=1 Tax=Martelella alba TaxID=2590451 RepID=A0A506UH82_9HYPH|nr:phosphomannomutase [Martelella alba]TPW32607.1 phosphomannomutase [Martelella alba]